MDWKEIHTESNKGTLRISNKESGIRVFKILKAHEPIKRLERNRSAANLDTDGTANRQQKYEKRKLSVSILFWLGKPYDGRKAIIEISEKVWRHIINLSLLLKNYGIPQPDYLMFWKRDATTIYLSFITEYMFNYHKDIIETEDRPRLQHHIHWYGAKPKFIHDKFIKWYKDMKVM